MTAAAFSIKAFSVYILVTGLGLLLAPAPFLGPLGIAAPTDAWIRVLGALALVVAYYYWTCGSAEAVPFMRATIGGRLAFAAMCVGLAATGAGPMQLILFGALDLAGAAWTARALARHRR